MGRLIFERQTAAPQVNTDRADVACFVGLLRVLPGASVSADVSAWLQSLGYPAGQIAQLLQAPLPFETYGVFTSIFDAGGSSASNGTDYVAAAVRSFFAQGGKLCYVVRTGDPISAQDDAQAKLSKLSGILPNPLYAPDTAATWTGVGNLSALIDVSYLSTPDLPALCASQPEGAAGQIPTIATGPEEFVVCSQADITPQENRTYSAPAPRLTAADYRAWAVNVAAILNYLAAGSLNHQPHLREIQYVAALPLPQEPDGAAAAENPSSDEIAQDIHNVIDITMPELASPNGAVQAGNISSAFLQLAYPWLKTSGSSVLLESLEPPDGALAGLLARNALTRGTFTSATKISPAEIYDVWPTLPPQDLKTSAKALTWGQNSPSKPLIERITLFGFTPAGLQLISDVTAYPGESYRPGPVNRLVNTICRAARSMGETVVFENNGPVLWGRVQRHLEDLMTNLWSLNALDGDSMQDAFSVRCDASTMTQNAIDNGQLLAEVTFSAASIVETIHVQLAFEAGGTSAQEIASNLAGVS